MGKLKHWKNFVVILMVCCLLVPPVSVQAAPKKYTTTTVSNQKYSNRWKIKKITKSEAKLLAQIVYLEARGEGNKGEQAVLEVIFNRVASKKFPNTIKGVLSQKNQFSTYKYRNKAKVRSTELKSIYKVLHGDTKILKNKKTVFFGTRPYNKKIELKYKHHYFCRY